MRCAVMLMSFYADMTNCSHSAIALVVLARHRAKNDSGEEMGFLFPCRAIDIEI